MPEQEKTLSREELAEIEDEKRKRQALGNRGPSSSMKELNASKKKNEDSQKRSHFLMMLLGWGLMFGTIGAMALLVMSLKH